MAGHRLIERDLNGDVIAVLNGSHLNSAEPFVVLCPFDDRVRHLGPVPGTDGYGPVKSLGGNRWSTFDRKSFFFARNGLEISARDAVDLGCFARRAGDLGSDVGHFALGIPSRALSFTLHIAGGTLSFACGALGFALRLANTYGRCGRNRRSWRHGVALPGKLLDLPFHLLDLALGFAALAFGIRQFFTSFRFGFPRGLLFGLGAGAARFIRCAVQFRLTLLQLARGLLQFAFCFAKVVLGIDQRFGHIGLRIVTIVIRIVVVVVIPSVIKQVGDRTRRAPIRSAVDPDRSVNVAQPNARTAVTEQRREIVAEILAILNRYTEIIGDATVHRVRL